MNSAVCTLFEGDYHLGVAGLANSLRRAGFCGTLWAGYRGSLPRWAANTVESTGARSYSVASCFEILFVHLNTSTHFGQFKPRWMRQVLTDLAPECDSVCYLDPDIVVEAPWSLLNSWISAGVAACEDVNSPVGEGHPWHTAWQAAARRHSFPLRHIRSVYANSGLLGCPREAGAFLELWEAAMQLVNTELGGAVGLKTADPYSAFHSIDQDALNLALSATDQRTMIAGRAAMGFAHGTPLLQHALGKKKPWRKAFVSEACMGYPPSGADKAFWNHVDGPIWPFPDAIIRRKKLALKLAAAIGRFYRRS